MRTHAEEGFRMLAMSNRRLLRLAGEVAWTHPDPDLVDHPFANWNKVETVRLLLPD